jgi:flagellar hook-length control protein FliK
MPDISISASPVAAVAAAPAAAAAGDLPAGPFAALLQQQMNDPLVMAAGLQPGVALAAATDPVTTAPSLETLLPLLLGAKGLASPTAAEAGTAQGAARKSTDLEDQAPSPELLLALPLATPVTPAALPAEATAKLGGKADATALTLPTAATGPAEPTAILAASTGTATQATAADATELRGFAALVAHDQETTAASLATTGTTASPVAAHLQPAANPTANAPAVIPTPVGAQGWDSQVGERLVWMAGRQESHAELVLTPPQLGRIEVSLTVSGDQTNALFVSANPAVREALESALPRLREMLADAGITLGQAQVGSEAPGQSANGRENGDNPQQTRAGGSLAGLNAATTSGTARVATAWGSGTGRGLVDVFA